MNTIFTTKVTNDTKGRTIAVDFFFYEKSFTAEGVHAPGTKTSSNFYHEVLVRGDYGT
jgi:hypothetical protein